MVPCGNKARGGAPGERFNGCISIMLITYLVTLALLSLLACCVDDAMALFALPRHTLSLTVCSRI